MVYFYFMTLMNEILLKIKKNKKTLIFHNIYLDIKTFNKLSLKINNLMYSKLTVLINQN